MEDTKKNQNQDQTQDPVQDQNTQNTDPVQDQNTENQDKDPVEEDKPGFFTRVKEAVFGWMVENPRKTFLIGGFVLSFAAFKAGQRSGVKKERKRVERESEEKAAQAYNLGLNDGGRRGGNDRNDKDRFNDRDKDRQHA